MGQRGRIGRMGRMGTPQSESPSGPIGPIGPIGPHVPPATMPAEAMDRVRRHTTAIDIVLIALVTIAAALPFLRGHAEAIGPDSRSYIVPAENLLAGRGLRGEGAAATFTESIPGYPRTPGPETLRPPPIRL